jgi:pilus assembly protein CpaB
MIPSGMRAVAVRVNDIVGVAGFVSPGMHVDLLIAGNPPGQNNAQTGTLTKTLMQNLEVISAGQSIQKDAEGKPVNVGVVNMLVSPEQAETLSLASNETRIQLILRNPMDKEETKTPGTAVSNLWRGTKGIFVTGTPAPDASKKVAKKAAPPPLPPPVPAATKQAEKVVVPITVEVYHGSTKTEPKFPGEEKDQKNPSEARP